MGKSIFDNTPLEWQAEGVEPSASLKTSGYKAGDSPSAENENYFRNRTYQSIAEIQRRFAGRNVYGETYTIDEVEYTAGTYAEVFNDYTMNRSVGDCTHSEGFQTLAKGMYTHSEGWNTKATYIADHAEGEETVASGGASHSGGNKTNSLGWVGFAHGYDLTANELNFVIGKRAKAPTAASTTTNEGDLFVIGSGLEGGAKSNAFRVTAAGQVLGTQAYAASGADFAELFEWEDGNPDNEDRRGLFVTLDGEKIRPATADDDYILGVVSAAPTVIGDAYTDDWQGKYETDEFGARVLVNGAWKLSETFEESLDENYTSRLERPEWDAVGLVGKLVVRDDGSCQVNGYCKPSEGGIATASETGYRVMARVADGYIKILVK